MHSDGIVSFVNENIEIALPGSNMVVVEYLELVKTYLCSIITGNDNLVFQDGVAVSGNEAKKILFMRHKKRISEAIEHTMFQKDQAGTNLKAVQDAFAVVSDMVFRYFSGTSSSVIDTVNRVIGVLVGPCRTSGLFLCSAPFINDRNLRPRMHTHMMSSMCKCILAPNKAELHVFVSHVADLIRREDVLDTDERVKKLSLLIENIVLIEGKSRSPEKGVFYAIVFSALCNSTIKYAAWAKSVCSQDMSVNIVELFASILKTESTRVTTIFTLLEREQLHIEQLISKAFIDPVMNTLFSHEVYGIHALLSAEKYADIERMSFMLGKINHPDVYTLAAEHVKVFTEKTISSIASSCENQTLLARKLIDFNFLSHTIAAAGFNRDPVIYMAMANAWKTVLKSSSVVKNAEKIMCEYIDVLLRPGNKTESLVVTLPGIYEGKTDSVFARISNLIGWSENIDKFSDMYMIMFVKRISTGAYNEDTEREALHALMGKIEQRMYNAMIQVLGGANTWSDMVQLFNGTLESTDCVMSNISLLPMMHVPNPSMFQTTLIPPKQLSILGDQFASWFAAIPENKNKKLSFAHALGKCTVDFDTGKKKYQVVMNDIQTAIVCLLNDTHEVSVSYMLQHTGLTRDHLLPSLTGLVKGKLLLEKKENEERVYSVNRDFEAKTTKITMPNPAIKLSEDEMSLSDKRVEENRSFVIQAAIVRIMKAASGSVNMNALFKDVITQIKQFSPTIKAYKQAVESLIEKEYLKRVQNTVSELVYIS